MENTCVFELKINKTTYDIASADTDFYSFMGMERLYCTFDRFVEPSDFKQLKRYLDEGIHDRMILHLIAKDDGRLCCIASVKNCEESDYFNIELIKAEEMIENLGRVYRSLEMKDAILGLYNDEYFEYDAKTELIRIFIIRNYEQTMSQMKIDEFEQYVVKRVADKDVSVLSELISWLRQGKRVFNTEFEGNILDDNDDASCTVISGRSFYDGDEYIYAAGYIRLGSHNVSNARKQLERDSLTGVLAKAEITNIAIQTIDVAKLKDTCIAIVDVDYFKKVNDYYGHMKGDEVLKEVAYIMEKEVGDRGLVGRIGGDEFFIIFYNVPDMEDTREQLRSIKNMVMSRFDNDNEESPKITLSIGCASYPKDANNYNDLFALADFALYRAKEKGRNRYIIYNKDKHGSLDEIKNKKMNTDRINSRGDMSAGNILCIMMDKVYKNVEYPLEKLLDDAVVNLGIQRIMIYAGSPYKVVAMAGEKRPSQSVLDKTQGYVSDAWLEDMFDRDGIRIMDDVAYARDKKLDVYDKLIKQSVLSFIQIRTWDRNNKPVIISLESVNTRVTWNRSLLPIYSLLARLLMEYEL